MSRDLGSTGLWFERAMRSAIPIAVCALASVPSPAQAPSLAMLDGLQTGQWDLRFRDGSPPRRMCLRDGRELIQLQHRETGCSRFVVEDTPEAVTVQYTCRGNGYGRTTVRRESASLVQIDTQGIVDGLPFQTSAEARRTGPCR